MRAEDNTSVIRSQSSRSKQLIFLLDQILPPVSSTRDLGTRLDVVNVIQWINLYTMVNAYSTRSVGVFFRREKVFVRESATLKLQLRGGNEASQRGRERGREEKREGEYFLLPPPPLPPLLSFVRAPNPKGCFFYSPQSSSVIKSKMTATTKRT